MADIKYKLMKNYVLGLVLLTLFSCTNNNTGSNSQVADTAAVKVAAPAVGVEFSKPVEQEIYAGYITLKNALVSTQFDAAKKAAADLSKSLKAREGCETTAVTADKIAGAKDIAVQRKEFVGLSADVIALFKHADLKNGLVYVQHCPMANDGNGADWLASESKIQNPYYGSEMMECGAVVEEIKTVK